MEDKTPTNIPRALLTNRRGNPVGRGARLTSINTPRDLTLGGVKKKVFTPTIPVRPRNKEKVVEQEDNASKPSTSKPSDRRDRGRGRGRGRGREREVIQSHSIFELGPSASEIQRSKGSRGDYSERSTSTSTVIKRKIKQEQTTEETDLINDILRDDFIAEHKMQASDPNMCPVSLPIIDLVKQEIKEEENEVEITDTEQKSNAAVEPVKQKTTSNAADLEGRSVAEMITKPNLKSESGDLMLFQMPDVLPGDAEDPMDQIIKQKNQATGAANVDSLTNDMIGCKLSDYKEGLIGKLRVYESGKVQLCLGDVALDITKGTPPTFLQDLACIETKENNEGIFTLGHLNDKLIVQPDMSQMLKLNT